MSGMNCKSQTHCSALYPPRWGLWRERILHPVTCVLMLPFFICGWAAAGIYAWAWNVRHSSSLGGCWRPEGPWSGMLNDEVSG